MSSKYTFNRLDEEVSNVGLYGQARVAFVRKVYSIVSRTPPITQSNSSSPPPSPISPSTAHSSTPWSPPETGSPTSPSSSA